LLLCNKYEPVDPINYFSATAFTPTLAQHPMCAVDTINNKIVYCFANSTDVIAYCGQINSDKSITWGAYKVISTENSSLCGVC
jgi:hypothetical protein